jgi:prophage antirepressor-like protein
MNSLINFDYQERPVRVIKDEDGAPWWVARDICEILDIKDASNATKNLDDDEKGTQEIRTLGGRQGMLTVNESGLYTLIFKSNKKEAKTFRKWITGEVLPAIRRDGKYEMPNIEPPEINNGLLVTEGIVPITVARLTEAAQGTKAAMIMARALGFRDNEARQLASQLVKRMTGLDVLMLLGSPSSMGDNFVLDFLDENIEEGAGRGTISVLDLYRDYCSWCKEHELSPLNKRHFNKYVFMEYPGIRKAPWGPERLTHWFGIQRKV